MQTSFCWLCFSFPQNVSNRQYLTSNEGFARRCLALAAIAAAAEPTLGLLDQQRPSRRLLSEGTSTVVAVVVPMVVALLLLVPLVVHGFLAHRRRRQLHACLQRGAVPADHAAFRSLAHPRPLPPTLVVEARFARCPAELLERGECPACLKHQPRDCCKWVIFACGHGICVSCLPQLIRAKQTGACCPLCQQPVLRCVSPIDSCSSTGGACAAVAPDSQLVAADKADEADVSIAVVDWAALEAAAVAERKALAFDRAWDAVSAASSDISSIAGEDEGESDQPEV